MLSGDFLKELKRATEAMHEKSMDTTLYGFQFQRGTRGNEGLSDEMVTEYERVLRVRFPHDFRSLLRGMNGTDLATLNVYGSCGEPPRESVGVYSYPRDIERAKTRIEDIRASQAEITADLAEQGFELPAEANLIPVYIHRYVVCTSILNRGEGISQRLNRFLALLRSNEVPAVGNCRCGNAKAAASRRTPNVSADICNRGAEPTRKVGHYKLQERQLPIGEAEPLARSVR
jgi:hypothetical protein